jgi:hypothetical protein
MPGASGTLAVANHSQVRLARFQSLEWAVCLCAALLKAAVRDHFGSSFGGETSANLIMKEPTLALKNPAR